MDNAALRHSRWWKKEGSRKSGTSYKSSSSRVDPNWPDELLPTLWAEVDTIDNETVERQQRLVDSAALCGDGSSAGAALRYSRFFFDDDRISYNVIATAVDALVAEVTQSEVRPMAISLGGSWAEQKKCEKLTNYFDAKWRVERIHETMCHAVRDVIRSGIGCVRIARANEEDPSNDKTTVERVNPLHVLMDDRGRSQRPREFYIRQFVERSHLADLFPDYEDEIWAASNRDEVFYAYPERRDSWVEVIEAIHLESAPGKKDGRRVLAIRNAILVDARNQSEHDNPYIFIRAIPPQSGWWGEQIVLRAAPVQMEMNKLLVRIQEAMHLMAVPRIFVERQAGIVEQHFDNEIGVIIEYDGQPPVILTPPSMSGEVYKQVERLESWCFKLMQTSELSATSGGAPKNMRLESGPSFRALEDVQTKRWQNFVRAYEKLGEDIAFGLVMREKEIAKESAGHRISAYDGKKFTNFPWNDIQIDPDQFTVRVQSASALPRTPAGKLAALEEMVKTGVIDQQTFVRLADVPDLESVRETYFAADDLLEQAFSRMLDEEGFYESPEPGLDFVKAKAMAQLHYFRAKIEEAPTERSEKLLQFIKDCELLQQLEMQNEMEMQEEAKAAAMQNAGTGPGMAPPPAGPPGMAPPQGPPGPMPPGMPPPGPGMVTGPQAAGGLENPIQFSQAADVMPPPNL